MGLQLECLEERTVLTVSQVNHLVVFGDSLADVGNDALATQGTFPNGNYYQGHFTNGPNWVDTLAKYLGQPAPTPSLAGGSDYAFGGATLAATPLIAGVPTVSQEVAQYLSSPGARPNANDLVAVWAGANDFLNTFTNTGGPVSPVTSADTLENALATLVHAGDRHFVVANLPPLGETPFISGLGVPGLSAAADQWAAAFNHELTADLAKLQKANHGVIVVTVDSSALLTQSAQANNPYGFVNWTDATGPLVQGSVLLSSVTATDPQDYLFFDGVHPTSKAHQLVGLEAAAGVYDALGIHNLVVTSTADTVDPTATGLSLREAVLLSNAMTGQQTITFKLGAGPHQINLSGTDLAITQNLTINGPSDHSLSISGQGQSRLFEVAAGVHARLTNLTLVNGMAQQGGAVWNAGHLDLQGDTFRNDTAQVGGAVYNSGNLSLTDGVFTGNTATSASLSAGGALANSGPAATATVFFTAFTNNAALGGTTGEGGAVANLGGAHVELVFARIAGNRAQGTEAWGGGLFDDSGSTLKLTAAAVLRNSALGNDSTGGHGLGGGLYVAQGAVTSLWMSLVSSNQASTSGQDVYRAT